MCRPPMHDNVFDVKPNEDMTFGLISGEACRAPRGKMPDKVTLGAKEVGRVNEPCVSRNVVKLCGRRGAKRLMQKRGRGVWGIPGGPGEAENPNVGLPSSREVRRALVGERAPPPLRWADPGTADLTDEYALPEEAMFHLLLVSAALALGDTDSSPAAHPADLPPVDAPARTPETVREERTPAGARPLFSSPDLMPQVPAVADEKKTDAEPPKSDATPALKFIP